MSNGNKIVVAGCHEAGINNIRSLISKGIKISYFVTISPEMAKDQNVSGYADFKKLGDEFDIPVYVVKSYSLKDEQDQVFFKEQEFDLLIQGGWQRLFPEEILKTLRLGAVGVHGSAEFLPKGRGRSPLNWSLIEGKERFIMHYFLIKPGVDDGDVFHYEMFDINPWDDIRTLYYKNSLITSRVLENYIPKLLSGDYKVYPQEGKPSYYPKRTAEDGLINWNMGIKEVYNFVRAITRPYPGAYSFVNDKKIVIWNAQPFDTRLDVPEFKIGEVVEKFQTGDFVIKCSGGLLLVTDYEIEGVVDIRKGIIFGDTEK
ncbi:MAG: formyltransferase family protein [Balneola sp.]